MTPVMVRISKPRRFALGCFGLVTMTPLAASDAQNMEQTIRLREGWNAVFFQVDPRPADAASVFAEAPVRSIWERDDSVRSNARFNCGPDAPEDECVPSTTTGWRAWYPPGNPASVINSLREMKGGRVYLIDASQAATLTIQGRPTAAVTHWRAGFNLAGFFVNPDPQATPTIGQYLDPSDALRGGRVFRLNADGTWAPVADPRRERIAPGEGYWIEARSNTVYDGPVRIDARSLRGLELSGSRTEHRLELENLGASPLRVTIEESAPAGGAVEKTQAPLTWLDFADGHDARWAPLDALSLELPAKGTPGSRRLVRLAADLQGMTGSDSDERSGVLVVRDATGYLRFIPFRARGADRNGLWVGDVSVDAVRPLTTDDEFPTPTGSPFTFRVILHKSDAEYRLLRDVVLAYQEEERTHALVTSSCPERLNPDEISPRISTANFSQDVVMTGDFDSELTPSAPIFIDATDPMNPFKHAFNPLHEVGFHVTRDFTMTFDPDGDGVPGYGVTWLAGDYAETIEVRAIDNPIYQFVIEASGRFELRKVSDIATLCGQ